ncbi:MAG: TIGR04282 family arsenosugar biosynthesis glycosyltransferase [Ketobacteraceae bacterium]|nr:TIGR04282 family arsenosugar biosynthesis glycosyltransferase [Ketobacteraceae bacterium]
MMDFNGLIQVFLKSPQPGKVKTRLIPDLGETLATDIHERLVTRVMGVCEALDVTTECWVAGDISLPFVQALGQRHALYEQQGLDLGERMYHALLHGLARYPRVVLVGADAYSLTPETINRAFASLDRHDVVLGPASDGGYILVGANKLHPDMFRDVDWGTASVLDQQLENIVLCGLHYELLPAGYDIDDLEDLRRFAPELLPGEPPG